MNITEVLASEVFGFPASSNSPNTFCYTRFIIHSPLPNKNRLGLNEKIKSDDQLLQGY